MTKQISKEQTKHIAKLVKLNLSEEEVVKLSEMLTDTLGYIDILDELDTSSVKPTFQVTGTTNVFLNKEVKTTMSREDVLQNASEEIDNLFATEAVFDRE